ncbi:hypothetical protein ACIOD2_30615 [Amycolatopsis sp. NPDC088138]|uniref:hypothetical protein n=1 Tax=Amycolatopsis sp. NPDC088138 TaxID=3363938 RepID=UPI0037FA8DD7
MPKSKSGTLTLGAAAAALLAVGLVGGGGTATASPESSTTARIVNVQQLGEHIALAVGMERDLGPMPSGLCPLNGRSQPW